jgi:beta-glucosidase
VYDKEDHNKLAREVASECMVLLKNEEEILPLKKGSHINPTKLDNIYEEIKKSAGSESTVAYAQGFDLKSDDIDDIMLFQAISSYILRTWKAV